MNFIHETITVDTADSVELINITSQVQKIIQSNNIENALINISTKHTTTGIIINEDETGLKKDIINLYERLIPFDNYFHDRIDNNARSHLKSLLSNPNQTLPVIDGKMSLGTWQSIFFVELDGPRKRRHIDITIII